MEHARRIVWEDEAYFAMEKVEAMWPMFRISEEELTGVFTPVRPARAETCEPFDTPSRKRDAISPELLSRMNGGPNESVLEHSMKRQVAPISV